MHYIGMKDPYKRGHIEEKKKKTKKKKKKKKFYV
jgi:hypothetical protein